MDKTEKQAAPGAGLESILTGIDAELRRKRVPLEIRPLHALLLLSERLETRITSQPGDETYRSVVAWFEKKYGDRLMAGHPLGNVAILIRDRLHAMTIPLVYGPSQVLVDPNVDATDRVQAAAGAEPAKIHVLNCIEGFTREEARTLSPVELKELVLYFSWAMGAFQAMNLHAVNRHAQEALGDLRRAVDHLSGSPPAAGKSKWASQRAVEGFLRAYLARKKGGAADKDPGLNKLVEAAYARGLRRLNPDNLEAVQCARGVRSGKTAVSLPEAVEAHHASIDLCASIASNR